MPEVLTRVDQDEALRALYQAAQRAEITSAVGRTFEEWRDRVSDYGLSMARHALEVEISTERTRLEREVIEATKKWRARADSHETPWIVSDEALIVKIDALIDFESQQEK